jgi:hypothetical protein
LNTHEHFDRREEIEHSSDRSFGIVLVVVFLFLGLRPLLHRQPVQMWMLGVSAASLTVALIRPGLLAPANAIWLRLGTLLRKIVGSVVTGLLFFFVCTPTGYLLRRFGKDLLALHKDSGARTYWIARTPRGPEAGSMTRQF